MRQHGQLRGGGVRGRGREVGERCSVRMEQRGGMRKETEGEYNREKQNVDALRQPRNSAADDAYDTPGKESNAQCNAAEAHCMTSSFWKSTRKVEAGKETDSATQLAVCS